MDRTSALALSSGPGLFDRRNCNASFRQGIDDEDMPDAGETAMQAVHAAIDSILRALGDDAPFVEFWWRADWISKAPHYSPGRG